jgi:hypothetical protein
VYIHLDVLCAENAKNESCSSVESDDVNAKSEGCSSIKGEDVLCLQSVVAASIQTITPDQKV